jgi:acetate kinase
LVCEGEFADIRHRAHLTARDGAGAPITDEYLREGATHENALAALLRWLEQCFPRHDELIAAGRRVVHGGAAYQEPVSIYAKVVAELTRLAPSHQPHHLAE